MTATPAFLQCHQTDAQAVRQELAGGLRQQPASVSPKFFYDTLGSRLFEAITELPEYYPTRTEAAVFAAHGAEMARHVPPGALMLDLGAGCCTKAARLFGVLQPTGYVAVDISVDFLRDTLVGLQQRHPALPMMGLGMDFSSALELPAQALPWLAAQHLDQRPRVVFYPGSSIGNFSPPEALRLLRQAHAVCQAGGAGGGLLIGVDRVKPIELLEPAYDDSLGVTAAFNRTLLRHVNQLLGADFAPRQWAHVAFFDPAASRIEMHLQSAMAQTVRWPGGERHFAAGERLHTENAYKWTPEGFAALLEQAGFRPTAHWSDERDWFSVFWATA
jgi:L-histidine Nalpha-methyltransferase